jgi:hypothetical protein
MTVEEIKAKHQPRQLVLARKGLRGDNGHRSHRRHYQRGGVGEQPH